MGISDKRLQDLIDDADGRASLQYRPGTSKQWFQDAKALLEELREKRLHRCDTCSLRPSCNYLAGCYPEGCHYWYSEGEDK